MKKLLLFFSLTLCLAQGQTRSIQGSISEVTTKQPLPFVSVFLEGTTIGTQSNEKGEFVLKNIPLGNYRLVASMVGYLPFVQSISVLDKSLTLKISLTTDIKALQEVKVISQRDKVWEKQYKEFEEQFLGDSFNKKEVSIANKEVLDFDFNKKTNTLTAQAQQPIVIENRTLGYKITYILQTFERNREFTSFKGYARYDELTPQDEKEKNRWIQNRTAAYEGSLSHFLKALLDNRIAEEGFDAYFLNPNFKPSSSDQSIRYFYQNLGSRHSVIHPKEIINDSEIANSFDLLWPSPIEVVYTKRKSQHPIYIDAPYPYSLLTPKLQITVTKNGNLLDPFSVEIRGEMGRNGLANLLPLDYNLPKTNEKETIQITAISEKPEILLQENVRQNQDQKIYLHTDKLAYFSGDTLWYKAYLSDATTNELLLNPQKVFVEIFSPNNKMLLQQVLKTQGNGIAWSSISLPDTLTSGNYILRAYSNWMRNAGEMAVFQKDISIKNIKQKNEEKAVSESKLDVQFFPEGGTYLRDVPTKIGIKISHNKGKIIRGVLLDKKDNKIANISTNALGMGSFVVKNEQNMPMKVQIEGIDYPLPKPQEDGFSIQIDNFQKDSIKINAFSSQKKENESIEILLQSRGIVYEEITQNLVKNTLSLAISKQNLPTGVYQLTLFDKNLVPQCERLLFIRGKATPTDIVISQSFDKRKMALSLDLETTENLSGEFSMSVADASQVGFSSNAENIASYLLLSSELKGTIENPNYYFQQNTEERQQDLDDLLLTQGWRRYKWQDVLEKKAINAAKFKEYEPLVIHGKLYSDVKKPIALPETNLMILPMDSTLRPIFTQTDKEGKFSLENLDFQDSVKFVVKVTNHKGKEIKAKIQINKNDSAFGNQIHNASNNVRLEEAFLENSEIRKYDEEFLMKKVKMLDEVTVKAKKTIDYNFDSNGNRLWNLYGEPDGVIKIDEKQSGQNIVQMIQGKIPSIVVTLSGKTNEYEYLNRRGGGDASKEKSEGGNFTYNDFPPLFLLDGIIMPPPRNQGSFLMTLTAFDIERIDYVVNAGASMYGVRGSNGVIAIYTKRGPSNTSKYLHTDLVTTKLAGFQKSKEFYEPKYETNAEKVKDIRDILLWKPSFQLRKGETNVLTFRNNDTANKILVIIEGILSNGEPCSVMKILELKK